MKNCIDIKAHKYFLPILIVSVLILFICDNFLLNFHSSVHINQYCTYAKQFVCIILQFPSQKFEQQADKEFLPNSGTKNPIFISRFLLLEQLIGGKFTTRR